MRHIDFDLLTSSTVTALSHPSMSYVVSALFDFGQRLFESGQRTQSTTLYPKKDNTG